MRYDRSNPMDAVKREPSVRGVLAFGLAAAVALGAIGIWSEVRTTRVRAENVERVVAAAGLGPATAHPLGGGCGRARRLFRWESDSAVGTACAGPRDKVELREISRR